MMDAADCKTDDPELRDASVTGASKTEFDDPSSASINTEDVSFDYQKRHFVEDSSNGDEPVLKKRKSEDTGAGMGPNGVDTDPEEDGSAKKESGSEDDLAHIPPATEGISTYGENDVLSGRGGGTNVHPGNRNFRDLINLHRRAYLKARKNDKPAISRAIVRAIRESNGKFLKKDEKSGLWYEIGDDAAREKTSQALRQRAPEMRKLLFDAELEEARMAADHSQQQQQQQQQRMMMGMPQMPAQMQMAHNPMLNQAFMAMAGKGGAPGPSNNGHPMNQGSYGQPMFPGVLYQNCMDRYQQSNPPPS